MDTTGNKKTDNIAELLEDAKRDRSAAGKLLQAFSRNLYKEARIYLEDEELAKKSVLQAFRNAYPKLNSVNAETIEDWLIQHVKDECVKSVIPLDDSKTVYTSSDEIPSRTASVPSDHAKIKSQLRTVLNSLTPSQRIVSVLKFRDQLSFEEIADKCNADIDQVKGLISDAKKTLRASNINLASVLALVNALYPFYTEPESVKEPVMPKSSKPAAAISADDQFNQSVLELKEFFNTKTLTVQRVSDHDIDDTDEDQMESEYDTAEREKVQPEMVTGRSVQDTASSAKLIMAAAMSSETEKKEPAKEFNPILYWAKRVAIVLLFAVIAFGIGILVSVMRSHKTNPVNSPEPAITETSDTEETTDPEETVQPEETIDTEETAIPEETEEPAVSTVGKAYILVSDLTIRFGPGIAYEQTGIVEPGSTYDVYESSSADGYTWYRIGENQWIADLEGQFVTYTPNS